MARRSGRTGKAVSHLLAAAGAVLTVWMVASPSARATGWPPGHVPPSSGPPVVGPVTVVSRCAGQNAETEEAVDPDTGDLFVEWMGCEHRIGFAVSTDDGQSFSPPIVVPDSTAAWDPSVSVGPDGTVYAAFMRTNGLETYPVVDASFDHGRTFPQVREVLPPAGRNYGDRDFVAAGPRGSVYLAWTYGPTAKGVREVCVGSASCTEVSGDVNVVVQRSVDGGRTWGPILPISPGFPDSGAEDPPLVVGPNGRVDVEYPDYPYTNARLTLGPAHSYFTSSGDGGASWSTPVRIGPPSATIAVRSWWIDGDIAVDGAGDLYITFDTQVGGHDVGWLSYSTDGGLTWSALRQATTDVDDAVHIIQPTAGAQPGTAVVGWLADDAPEGWALYVRPFSLGSGWLGPPTRVSPSFGLKRIWAGDTFGMVTIPGGAVAVSWGSAVPGNPHHDAEIYAATLTWAGTGQDRALRSGDGRSRQP
jgi:hypothetical protein